MKQEQEELLELLHPLVSREQSKKTFRKKRQKQVGLTIAAVVLFCAGAYIREQGQRLENENQLQRPPDGQLQYELTVSAGEQEADILLEVLPRQLTGEELEEQYYLAYELLKQKMLGENESLEEVTCALELVEELPEYGMDVIWDTSDAEYIRGDGTVRNTALTEGVEQVLGVTLQYGEDERSYAIELQLLPYPYEAEELFVQSLRRSVEEYNEQTAYAEYQGLPEQLDGTVLHWQLKKQNYWKITVVMGLLVIVLVYYRAGAALQQKKKEREEQLLIDYPALLGKMILLLGAGLTVRGAWERMAAEYGEEKKERYAYAELQRALLQMELGMPEQQAYEQFGIRCGLLPYLRFTTLLVQNLKKGSRRLIPLLQMESQEAFSERKEQARRKGEEAGTKLLLPMGGMLVIVLVMILVPAFISFQL